MRIYISGPITGVVKPQVVFGRAAENLVRAGYEVLNPFEIEPICDCPPGAELTNESAHYSCYMRGDIAGMLHCDGVAMLDGWERSKGALLEHFVALSVCMKVMSLSGWMKAGVKR